MAKLAFTAARVAAFTCPPGKSQALAFDSEQPGLGLRTTPNGSAAYVFQASWQGNPIRITIGSPDAWPLPKAREEARRLQRLIDQGLDPREVRRAAQAEQDAAQAEEEMARAISSITVAQAWEAYLADRKPHWGERHHQDHVDLARAGGQSIRRGTRGRGKTIAGPIHPLLAMPLNALDSATVDAWASREAKVRPTRARLALRILKAFLGWCAEHEKYRQAMNGTNPAKSKRAREALGKAKAKDDALLKEQLPAWFGAVRSMLNATSSAYLQVLLLTGARPSEVQQLRWDDIGWQWKSLTIRDKVEGERRIPLTPYVEQLLKSLPHIKGNPHVFASASAKSGRIIEPNRAHTLACAAVGIEGLTLHGLRRSFGSLSEWLEVPAGVVAQIMGHRPSATAEKHYRVRPLDMLRVHHERIERWMLEQGRVEDSARAES